MCQLSTANTSVSDMIFLLSDSDQIFFMTLWAVQITGNLIISSEILQVRFCEPPCNPYQGYTRWQIWRTLVIEIPSVPCHHNNNISKLNPLVPTVMRCKAILFTSMAHCAEVMVFDCRCGPVQDNDQHIWVKYGLCSNNICSHHVFSFIWCYGWFLCIFWLWSFFIFLILHRFSSCCWPDLHIYVEYGCILCVFPGTAYTCFV